jgi:non-lysosomal glucosylceramidase
MKILKLTFLCFLICSTAFSQEWESQAWPILKSYDKDHLFQIALPLGGIGTGTVSLGGRGELRDWEIMNVPGKKYSTVTTGNNAPFFAIYTKSRNGKSSTALLAGPLYPHEYLHYEGRPVNHHGLPRFEEASFDAAYPFGQVHLSDKAMPVKVTIKGFNPLVPGDEDASSLPIAILSYEVENITDQSVEVAICGSIRNFIGKDGSRFRTDWKGDYIPIGAKNNKNEYRRAKDLQGIYFYSDGVDQKDTAWGTMALVTQAVEGVTFRTSSKQDSWNNGILNFWDDFSEDGVLVERDELEDQDPMASLAIKKLIQPHEKKTFTFFLTWNFPNRKAWSNTIVGNYYSQLYFDAWDAAEKIIPQIPDLEKKTLSFVNTLLKSSYPGIVKEAALFNLATLRSQTVFWLPDGHLMGWEGVMDRFGSCHGSCTHVWNYEVATPFLFGNLAKTMRDVEFNYATKENGLMNFRASLPLSEANKGNAAAADGQMGCIMKFYREWQLSGDNRFLESNWEQVKKVLSYAWAEKGWDGNQDGVMEGSQHNTMDVDYYGPNPQMGFWYMGALRAAEEMALAMKDKAFAGKCRHLFEKGSAWMDENLFNGEYYEHKITDPQTFDFLDMNQPNTDIPPFQLGRGCLVDQLVGQYMAHICGLGYLGNKNHMRTTLESIIKYNYIEDFSNHFNNMRSFAIGDESGLLMASWPKGRLEVPFPYFAEVMTGFEYCAAVGMIYEGMEEDALRCVEAIRKRHDGAKRNPFSEPECGHHYARSMASWGLIVALSEFQYSGIDKTMSITSRPGTYFWSNGYAWGLCEIGESSVKLEVLEGSLCLDKFSLSDGREKNLKHIQINEGECYIMTF